VIVTPWLVMHPTCLKILTNAAGNISGVFTGKGTTMTLSKPISK
jgi:hypothetical protein